MKLRTQLIVAFLLLSVLPLAGVTLYSYSSSIGALREAAAAEASALTEDMDQRMELVTADLERRVGGLGQLPYQMLLAGEDERRRRHAGRFVYDFVAKMGDAAPMIDALEFMPATSPEPVASPERGVSPEPAAPESPALATTVEPTREVPAEAHPGAEVGTFVVRLSHQLIEQFGEGDWEVEESSAEVLQSGEDILLLPLRFAEAGVKLGGEEQEAAFEFVVDLLESVGDQERVEEMAEEFSRQIEERARAFAEEAERMGRLETERKDRLEAELERLADSRRERSRAETRFRPLRFSREFEAPVHRGGELVGSVRARVNAGEVLHSVLSRARREQGEIPFAMDGEGNLYTPDPEDEAVLEEVGAALRTSDDGEAPGVAGNWVIVTRGNPAAGVTFGIARPIGDSLQDLRRTAVRNLGYGLVIVAVAMLGIFPLSGRMTRNLSRLTEGAAELARGNLDARVTVVSRDEFGALGATFNRMAGDLRQHQQRLVRQERISKELEMCRQIQDEMLPHGRLRLPFAEVSALSIPAREVGGDFFNYFTLPGGEVALLMGDVSGKGLPAALMMANLQATLRARMPLESDLARLADSLDREIEDSTRTETYLTLFMGIIEAEGRKLRFVNAGHNVQYLLSASGEMRQLRPSGRPLGLMSGGGYTEERVELNDGDSLVLFTDGLTEAENDRGEQFGAGRLEELLRQRRDSAPDELLMFTEEAIRRYRGEAEASDDASMLVLRFGEVNQAAGDRDRDGGVGPPG